jgi:hypothetical protein
MATSEDLEARSDKADVKEEWRVLRCCRRLEVVLELIVNCLHTTVKDFKESFHSSILSLLKEKMDKKEFDDLLKENSTYPCSFPPQRYFFFLPLIYSSPKACPKALIKKDAPRKSKYGYYF